MQSENDSLKSAKSEGAIAPPDAVTAIRMQCYENGCNTFENDCGVCIARKALKAFGEWLENHPSKVNDAWNWEKRTQNPPVLRCKFTLTVAEIETIKSGHLPQSPKQGNGVKE